MWVGSYVRNYHLTLIYFHICSHFYNPGLGPGPPSTNHKQHQMHQKQQLHPTSNNALEKLLEHQARLKGNERRGVERKKRDNKVNSDYGNVNINPISDNNNIVMLEKLSSNFFQPPPTLEDERKKLEFKLNYYKSNLENYRHLNDKQVSEKFETIQHPKVIQFKPFFHSHAHTRALKRAHAHAHSLLTTLASQERAAVHFR